MAEQWATSSNEALRLQLVGAPHLGERATFHPAFTYPIFGEAETIYGYKNLHLDLALQSDSLLGALDVQHDGKIESKTAKIDAPREALMEYLAKRDVVEGKRTDLDRLSAQRSEGGAAFQPLGRLIHSYTRPSMASSANGKGKGRANDRTLANLSRAGAGKASSNATATPSSDRHFEIYHCDWKTPGFVEYHRRMQLFALLYIEGASYIDEEESNWEFLTVYEVTKSADADGVTGEASTRRRHHFVGYTSLYNFWFYPTWHRLRLSQLVVLPPYQGQGHGSEVYGQVVQLAQARDSVVELTIEDPSEAFDRLRDSNDLKRLLSPDDGFLQRARDQKKGGALRAPLDKAWSELERKRHKLARRQWDRLVEMCMLMMLDDNDADQVTRYRLQVKGRLYGFNRDVLQQMPQHERVAKLQETFESVMDEYSALTGVDVDAIVDAGVDALEQNGAATAAEAANGQPAAKIARFA